MIEASFVALSPQLDPFRAEALADPMPTYRLLRDSRSGMVYLPDRKLWIVSRYEDSAQVLRDYRSFVSSMGVGYTRVAEHGYRYPLVDTDPPEHTRVRRAVQSQFAKPAMDSLRPGIRDAALALVDAAVAEGTVDVVPALAQPLPDLTIRLLTGIQPPDGETMIRWADAVGQLAAPDLDPRYAELASQSLSWLVERGLLDVPAHCMARLLMEHGGDNGGLAAEGPERLMTLDSIWLAGVDSSSSLLGNAVNAFTEFPGQWEAIRADPSLIPNAVEELLRWDSPFRSFYRRSSEDTVIGDVAVPADADVCVMLASANRDPRRFADPDRFDVRRADAKHHLALGTSIHLCLGAPVARIEAAEFISVLAAKVRRFERAGTPVRAASQTMRKFDSLPVRLIPA